jgi:uncharacterized LabA/DUF88 family protein
MAGRGRTIAFFDNSNVFHGQLACGWRIDAKRLQTFLEGGGEIWQTFFFASVTDPPRYQQTNFYKFLKNELHWEISLHALGRKTVTCRKCGDSRVVLVEKGVDVALATKLLTLANSRAFDTAILISGDRDYLDTVRLVKGNGLRVEIVSWRSALSPDLASESSRPVVFLDDIRNEIELGAAPDLEAERLSTTDS